MAAIVTGAHTQKHRQKMTCQGQAFLDDAMFEQVMQAEIPAAGFPAFTNGDP